MNASRLTQQIKQPGERNIFTTTSARHADETKKREREKKIASGECLAPSALLMRVHASAEARIDAQVYATSISIRDNSNEV